MKKAAAVILASIITSLAVTSVTVHAEDRSTLITTTISPTFTVTVPLSVKVPFNSISTDFGTVSLDAARLESDKCVVVTLETDNTLDNKSNPDETIPYSIHNKSDDSVFVSGTYISAGEKSDLSINIKQDDWNSAYAGDYEDTVTFHIQYTDK